MAQGLKIGKLGDKCKTFFCESEANVETLPNPSPYIWVSYKMVLKPAKSLNQIL